MADNGNNENAKHLPVFKLDGRRNKMEFIRSFPGIADHYGVRAIIYENVLRPENGDDLAERQAQWDTLNRVALEKLRFYVSVWVDDMVTQGEEITAREYYRRLSGLFLRTGVESVATLNRRLAACKYVEGAEIFEWLAKLDGIYAQFKAAQAEIPDQEKKHRAMGLISDVPIWGSMAHLLGTSDAVSYTDWREGMLRKEEEFEINGVMAGQKLADELYGMRLPQESALPATALHQTFRGSGFRRGRMIPRGWGARNFGVNTRGRPGGRDYHNQAMARGLPVNRGNIRVMAGSQGGRGVAVGMGHARPIHCFTCGGVGHVSAQCPSGYGLEFSGSCHRCGQWGHQSMFLRMNLIRLMMGTPIFHKVTTIILMLSRMWRSINRSKKNMNLTMRLPRVSLVSWYGFWILQKSWPWLRDSTLCTISIWTVTAHVI